MGDQPHKFTRRAAICALSAAVFPSLGGVSRAQSTPSASAIERQLGATANRRSPIPKTTVQEFKRNRNLRRIAPSINIQSINFEFGAARIPSSEQWKVQRIATAMRALLKRNPEEIFLIEGHTDAVGSNSSNLVLSQRRADSLVRQLRRMGVRRRAMEPIGYGEEDLLIPTEFAEWRNRRVTLRRITDFIVLR